jgi:hypothetical protein
VKGIIMAQVDTTLPNLDWVLAGIALLILIGGIWMVFSGTSGLGD